MFKQAKILVVDDIPRNIRLLKDRLLSENHRVIEATNGLEALEKVKEETPDLILLDIMMPQMDGYQALKHLKADNTLRHIPIIMISAMDDMANIVRCIEIGAEDYLTKPFNPVLLKARIDACLEKKWLRDQEEKYRIQLEEYNVRLQRLSQFKSELLSIVSHELRTPLTSIDGFTRLIQERFLTDDFVKKCNDETRPTIERVKQRIGIVQENTSRLARLVNDLLDFSRIEGGRELEMTFAPLELSNIIENVINTYQEPASQKNISLIYEGEIPLQTNSLQVYGDADRLSQALSNLVSNAIKFTQQGQITIGTKKVDDMIEINVRDTGVGIEEDKLSAIFEPFEQAGGTDARKRGTGLGLALVKYIARKHGGSIRVESKVGEGSNFILSLPEHGARPVVTEPRRILIVDDDFDTLKLLEEGLSNYQSYRIITASNGEEALKILEKQECDVMITDVRMPGGISGLDLARKVRETHPNLKVFVMTNTPQEKERVVSLESDWIDKASPDLINYIAKKIG